jgi:mycoredoxin
MSHSLPRDLEETSATPESNLITMYSTTWCGACHRAKRIFDALGVPYVEIDIEEDADAEALVEQINHGMHSVPTILFPDGTVLVEPAFAQLSAKLVLYVRQESQED